MAHVKVSLYQSIKVAGKWVLRKAPEQRLRHLSEGGYYVRFGNRMEPAGRDPAVALAALKRKQAELNFIAVGGEVYGDENTTGQRKRVTLADAVKEYIADCRDRQGKSGYGLAPRTVEAYEYRLGFLTAFRPLAYLDEIDTSFLRAYRRYLREHPDDLSDRSCYNAMQAASTFLIRNNNMTAKPILREMSFPPKPVITYSDDELVKFFSACDDEEKVIFKFFLHSMAREREVAFTEVRDLHFDRNVLHISPKPDKGFRLKGKRSGQAKNGRRVPLPATYMATLKEFCKGKPARALLFPNAQGGIENHFLRRCKAIAKNVRDWQPGLSLIYIAGGRRGPLATRNLACRFVLSKHGWVTKALRSHWITWALRMRQTSARRSRLTAGHWQPLCSRGYGTRTR